MVKPKAEVLPFAVSYMKTVAVATPASLVTVALSGVFRGLQNPKALRNSSLISCATNVVMDIIFVFGEWSCLTITLCGCTMRRLKYVCGHAVTVPAEICIIHWWMHIGTNCFVQSVNVGDLCSLDSSILFYCLVLCYRGSLLGYLTLVLICQGS